MQEPREYREHTVAIIDNIVIRTVLYYIVLFTIAIFIILTGLATRSGRQVRSAGLEVRLRNAFRAIAASVSGGDGRPFGCEAHRQAYGTAPARHGPRGSGGRAKPGALRSAWLL